LGESRARQTSAARDRHQHRDWSEPFRHAALNKRDGVEATPEIEGRMNALSPHWLIEDGGRHAAGTPVSEGDYPVPISRSKEAAMPVETELKFRLPAKGLAVLTTGRLPRFQKGQVERQHLVSTYFDTAKHKLKRRGLTLRIRQTQDKKIQTVKANGHGQIGRGEWEAEVGDLTPDLGKASDTPLQKLGAKKLRRKLKPVFKTLVERTVVPLHTEQAEIELAVDRGKIETGRRGTPLAEIELELKSGRPRELFHLARTLEHLTEAELYLPSKPERGYDLTLGKAKLAHFAEAISLPHGMEAIEAFRTIIHSTMRHFADNADAVRARDAEGIHQMRVGLRRTRAAISLFAGMLPKARTERIKSELKWLTNELAPARELDVFMRERVDPAARDSITRRGGRAIKSEFAARRRQAFTRAQAAINSSRYRLLLIDILEWLETETTSHTAAAQRSIEDFAGDILHRRLKKICKDGKHLDRLTVSERHKLRIKTKKIRYAFEFFDSLFPGKHDQKELARLSGRLKALQSALGSLNDFAAHREMTEEAALHAPRAHRRARAFMAGVILGKEEEAAKPVLKTAAKAIKHLGSVSAF
jgi:inorganic triphosphatase YgiF